VLSTPLMVLLARTEYSDTPGQDPVVLLDTARFPTPEALEEHLLAGFVPAVYRRRPPAAPRAGAPRRHRAWDPERAQHYLGYLAGHLDRPGQTDHQDLAWWRLGSSLRASSRILAVVLACTVVTAVSDWLVFSPVDAFAGHSASFVLHAAVLEALLYGPAVGLAFGLVYGIMVVFGATVFEPSRLRLRMPGRSRRAGGAPAARRFRKWFSAGLLAGFMVGLGYGSGLTIGQEMLYGTIRVNGLVIENTSINMFVFGMIFGLSAGLALGFTAALETPLDLSSAATPANLLAVNRTTVIRQALVLAPMLTLTIALGGMLITELFQGLLGPLTWPITSGLAIGAVGGLVGASSYVLVFTAWGHWVLFGRILLPLTGRLPWATITFLDDAYQRGVLRQAGAVYQFRHARLQSQLSLCR
jgi:hypothetical protein